MTGTIKIIGSFLILILLSGCFGNTLFNLGGIPVKTGDIITKPITKSMVDNQSKPWYIIEWRLYDNNWWYKTCEVTTSNSWPN